MATTQQSRNGHQALTLSAGQGFLALLCMAVLCCCAFAVSGIAVAAAAENGADAVAASASGAGGAGPEGRAPLRVTLLLEHAQAAPWTDMLRAGLERAGRDFGMRTAVVVAGPDTDQTAAFRTAAGESDLVIVASDNFHEILRDNAANFRRVLFGCVDAGVRAPNIMSVTFADEQAAFLAGAGAALLTRATGLEGINGERTIAWLSGADTPAMRSLFNGFAEGAQLADPQVRVIQAVVGSFTDPATAGVKAANLLKAGADVVALAAGAGNGAALEQVRAAGGYAVGLDAELAARYPGHVPCSILKRADRAVYEIAASAASPRFRGKEIITYDLANGGVALGGLEQFRAAAGPPAADMERRMGELRRELENGAIRLRSLRARTLCDCL